MKTYKKTVSVILWILAAILLWELASYLLRTVFHDPLASKKIPDIFEIASSFTTHGAYLLGQAGITMSYALTGFSIGVIIGIMLALAMSISGICEKMILPYLLISQMIPILGLAPIIFGLFKDVTLSRIIIAAYIAFFPVSVNMLSGLISADESLKTMLRAFASGRRCLYTKLLIPYSLPYLFAGLKISAPMAVTAAILSDTLSSKDGIGYVIILTLYGGGTAGQFWPALLIAALLGLMSFLVVSAVEYALVPWKRQASEVST